MVAALVLVLIVTAAFLYLPFLASLAGQRNIFKWLHVAAGLMLPLPIVVALFVFTFSRNTFPEGVAPVAGEPFVFTQFSGAPQCFLTGEQLVDELAAVGFLPEPAVPLTEYNRPAPGARPVAGGPASPTRPVIYEAAFRRGR